MTRPVPAWRMAPLAALLLAASAGRVPAAPAVPSASVAPWAPAAISSDQFESHAAFDRRADALYFVRSKPDFSGWRILASHCGAHGWETPVRPAFAGAGLEADPWLTPDGETLYFISTRASGSMASKDLDIWTATRNGEAGWDAPTRLPAPVNSDDAEWFPRLARDGWLYFGSRRPGGAGGNDIWRARKDADGAWRVENAGPGINTSGDEYEALPSPDGRTLLLMASGGLYRAHWQGGTWIGRGKLPPPVTVNGSEIGAVFSPSGNSVLFSRDTGSGRSGEFFLWRLAGEEAWPPACPAPPRKRAAGSPAPAGLAAAQSGISGSTSLPSSTSDCCHPR